MHGTIKKQWDASDDIVKQKEVAKTQLWQAALLRIKTLSPCICKYVEEESRTENHFHLDHCFSLSVKGTYITPIRGFILTLPSSSLSYCSSIWFPPAGPTGNINLPPGFN